MRILNKIKKLFKYFRFKVFCILKHNKVIKPLILNNPEYIILENNVRIKSGARIECYNKFFSQKFIPKLHIYENTIIGYNFSCLVTDEITIGKNTILASNILITSENHGINPELDTPYYEQELISGKVHIGEGCWIGEKAVILPNVTIGNKSVIAAGAVVTKNIPDYCIAAGVPAKVIKKYDFKKHAWINV